MRSIMGRLLIFTMSLLLIQGLATAQSYKFNTDPKGVKLPVQNVLDIEQDSLGRMWFSTARGVVYSDGIHTYELPDTLVKRFNYRISFLKDEDGIMWLYNASGIPVIFEATEDGWRESIVPLNEVDQALAINLFSQGRGASKYFFMDTGTALYYWKVRDEKVTVIERDFSQTHRLVSVLDDSGEIILNFKYQSFKFDGEKLVPYEYRGVPLPSPPFVVKKHPHSGEYYFLGKDFLAKGPKAEFPTHILSTGFSNATYLNEDFFSLEFSEENVLYHFNSHLVKYNPARSSPLPIDLSDLFNSIYIQTIYLDREGILWVGTSRGMANNNSQLFQNYGGEVNDFLGKELTAISDLGEGSFLFGFNNGIQIFRRGEVRTVYKDKFPQGSPDHRIFNFSNQGKSGVWFSANRGGVGYYDRASGNVTLYPAPGQASVSSAEVAGDSLLIVSGRRVFIAPLTARGNQLYASELTAALDTILVERAIFYRKAAKLKNGKIIILRASKLENRYPIIDNDRFLLVEGYDHLELPDGSVLIATEFGLKVYRSGYLGHYVHQGKMITNSVFSLLIDREGNIWAGTDRGVFVLGKDRMRHYSEKNGLVGDEINRGALIEASSGRVMIGTQKGLSIYFPDEEHQATCSPQVYLSSVQLGGNDILEKNNFQVSYSQNFLETTFLAPAFNESRSLWIHYRLLNSRDSTWTILKNPGSNQLFFSNMPAGKYRFELKASYDGEDFSRTVTTGDFEVLLPFYLQTWFVVLAVVFLLALGFLISRFVRQIQNLGVLQTAVRQESKRKAMAEQQFKNVWTSTQDRMLLTLEGEEILTVNPAFAKMMDCSVSDLEGKSLCVLFKNTGHEDFYLDVLLRQVRATPGKGISLEMPIDWKTGVLEMEVYSVMLEESFRGKGLVLSVFKDITAQKAVQYRLLEAKEKAEQANAFKSSLLSNISHEIRTPLNGIIGGAEHIKMSRMDDPELLSQLDIILQSGERLLDTINSLLDIAKIEANKMPVVYTPTEVRDFLEMVIGPHRATALRKGLDLEFSFLDTHFEAKIDRRFLEMILNNLISNSIKYSESGKILVSCRRVDSQLLLEVTDSGIGISEEFQSRMFDPFEQESKGNDRLFEGTGLGLSITRNLVQLMGGKIKVWSIKHQGTRVSVEIPLLDA